MSIQPNVGTNYYIEGQYWLIFEIFTVENLLYTVITKYPILH